MLKRLKKLFINKIFGGLLTGIAAVFLFNAAVNYTSTDRFCESCHVHPQANESWRLSTHKNNKSGITVHCVECHLPPGGIEYYTEKARLGLKDTWGKLFKDESEFNWEEKSRLEHAVNFTYKESCLRCHQNLFPLQLSKKGEEAHLHYSQKPDQLRCINCHLHSGHYSEQAAQTITFGIKETEEKEIYAEPAKVDKFENFTEFIPGSSVKFDMAAIPGGTFKIGSPEDELFRKTDEGPERTVKVSKFWMGKAEVTWDEYGAFYSQTASEGRSDTRKPVEDVDKMEAITGATPPYGSPDQGWGKGSRPAITMTYYAATVYCRWLSKVTGKKYRLPTEAEWEYACRGGTETPYFFEGSPKKFTQKRLWNRIFGADTTVINTYVIYEGNSGSRTQPPSIVNPNPFGLLNMSGNVREFCQDWYSPDTYSQYPGSGQITDPKGPENGKEHVIRGGSFRSDAADIRSAARDRTKHENWLVTDPQIPKSFWWYSDCINVGFRVVCEVEEK